MVFQSHFVFAIKKKGVIPLRPMWSEQVVVLLTIPSPLGRRGRWRFTARDRMCHMASSEMRSARFVWMVNTTDDEEGSTAMERLLTAREDSKLGELILREFLFFYCDGCVGEIYLWSWIRGHRVGTPAGRSKQKCS